MKFVVNTDPKRFDEFCFRQALNHYSKTSPFLKLSKLNGYQGGHLLTVESDQQEILASAVMVHKNYGFTGIQYSYCQYGFNGDFENRELMIYLMDHLKSFAKDQGSCFLRIDPNIPRLEHQKDGSLVEGGFNNEWFTSFLVEQGFHHLGYNYGYSGNWMSRYTYVKDLDMPWKDCLKSIKRCANYTSKNHERKIEVIEGNRENLSILVDAQQELASKLGFFPKKLSYFEQFWDAYEPYARFFYAKTNYHQAKLELSHQLELAKSHLLEIKDENKCSIEIKHIESLEKEIQEIESMGLDVDKEYFFGGKYILQQGDKVWNVNMYTKKTLLNFRAAFALHLKAMEESYRQGAKSYDFEGIAGTMDPKDPMYGHQNFKKSFGGDFIEFLGEFDCVFDEKKYRIWKKTDHLYRAIRRRLAKYFVR